MIPASSETQILEKGTQIESLLLVVAAVLIDSDNRILVTQRPAGKWMAGKWEFPGGKVEPRETPEAALVRELQEELGTAVRPDELTPYRFVSHTYPERMRHVLMPTYICRTWVGEPQGQEAQALKWVSADQMEQIDFLEADLPLIPLLCEDFS